MDRTQPDSEGRHYVFNCMSVHHAPYRKAVIWFTHEYRNIASDSPILCSYVSCHRPEHIMCLLLQIDRASASAVANAE